MSKVLSNLIKSLDDYANSIKKSNLIDPTYEHATGEMAMRCANELRAALPAVEAERKELMDAIEVIAGNEHFGEYESEYDGRTYTFCLGCDFQDDVRPRHNEACTYLKVRTALARAKEK